MSARIAFLNITDWEEQAACLLTHVLRTGVEGYNALEAQAEAKDRTDCNRCSATRNCGLDRLSSNRVLRLRDLVSNYIERSVSPTPILL